MTTDRKGGCHHDLRIHAIYLRAHPVELDRDLLGIHRDVRTARSKTARWLDCGVSGDHGPDERDRILFSVPWVLAILISLYLNVFVLIVQLFRKVPALNAMAPTQSEPPFKITQLVVLAIFVVLTVVTAIRFHEQTVRTA